MRRRGLRGLSTVLIIAGLALVIDAGLTVVWQEPVSALYARITQNQLNGSFRRLEAAPVDPVVTRALARTGHDRSRRMAILARALRRRVRDGQAIGQIAMPSLKVKWIMVQGTGEADLRKGPGHYPSTQFPGLHGTVAVAGHRTTYLAPFRRVDQLHKGDPIVIRMPYGRFTYRVDRTRIVLPTALWVTKPVGHDQLVLSACHPLYSASHRIVVFARLVKAVPLGAAAMGS